MDGGRDEVEDMLRQAFNRVIDSGKPAKPDVFRGRPGDDINSWIYKFNFSARSNGWDEEKKLKKLPTFLSDTAMDFYALNIAENDAEYDTCEKVIAALKKNFLPANYETVLREELENIKQGADETVSSFLLKVKKKCRHADEEMPEKDIIRLMLKGMNPRYSRQVFKEEPETVDDVEKIAKQVEAGYLLYAEKEDEKTDLKESIEKVKDELQSLLIEVRDAKSSSSSAGREPSDRASDHYGFAGNRFSDRRVRFARPVTRPPNPNDTRTHLGLPKCFSCGRTGHIARNCSDATRTMTRNNDERRERPNETPRTSFPANRTPFNRNGQRSFIRRFGHSDALFSHSEELNDALPQIRVTIINHELCFTESFWALVDTGSTVTLCSRHTAECLGFGGDQIPLRDDLLTITCVNGSEVKVDGAFTTDISFYPCLGFQKKSEDLEYILHESNFDKRRVTTTVDVVVADISFPIVLGMDFIMKSSMFVSLLPHTSVMFGAISLKPVPNGIPPHWLQRKTECFVDEDSGRLLTSVGVSLCEDDHIMYPFNVLKRVDATIDSGSLYTVIDRKYAESLDGSSSSFITKYENRNIKCTNGSSFPIYGRIQLFIHVQICPDNLTEMYKALPMNQAVVMEVSVHAIVVENFPNLLTLGQSFLRSAHLYIHPLSGTIGALTDCQPDHFVLEGSVRRHPRFLLPPHESQSMPVLASHTVYPQWHAPDVNESRGHSSRTSSLVSIHGNIKPRGPVIRPDYRRIEFPDDDDSDFQDRHSEFNQIERQTKRRSAAKHESSPNEAPPAPDTIPDNTPDQESTLLVKDFLRYYENLVRNETKYKRVVSLRDDTTTIPFDGHEMTVGSGLPDSLVEGLTSILLHYRNTFSFPGEPLGECFIYPFVIHTENEIPVRKMPYLQNQETRQAIREEVEEGLKLGIYRHSNSAYAANAHLVPKEMGKRDSSLTTVF